MTNNKKRLTSLMKHKFGVTKSSTLKFTTNDDLYSKFKKLATHLYKNGEWTQQDEINAVDTLIRNREDYHIGKPNSVKRKDETRPIHIKVYPSTLSERNEIGTERVASYSPYTVTIQETSTEGKILAEKTRYYLLDPQNKVGSKHNRHWWLNRSENKTFGYANLDRAIGYDKLQRDILSEIDKNEKGLEKAQLSREQVEAFLEKLTSQSYSGKKWRAMQFHKSSWGDYTDEYLESLDRDESSRYWAIPPEISGNESKPFKWRNLTVDSNSHNKLNLEEAPYKIPTTFGSTYLSPKAIEDARSKNRLINFIQSYIEDTYNIILQCEYEKDIEKQTRASVWQTKKTINHSTQKVMDQTSLKECFGFVELDNEVDLSLFKNFELEMKKIYSILPKANEIPDLRLRKLGNHKALGLFVPVTNTIAIDFRSGDDKENQQLNYAPNGVGIQSFIHEYGHFLDFNIRGDGSLLSMQDDFRSIISSYRNNVQKLPKESYVAQKLDYYQTPTEIWARAFELYSSGNSLDSNLIKAKEIYKNSDEYKCFDDVARREISHYFEMKFPNYPLDIQKFNHLEEEKSKEKKEQNSNKNDINLNLLWQEVSHLKVEQIELELN